MTALKSRFQELCTTTPGSYNNFAGRKALHPTLVAFNKQADLPAAFPRFTP